MADELIDICDENNNLIDIQKMKSEAHKDGLWHRASHIWIYNSNGEILLQLRAKEKPLYVSKTRSRFDRKNNRTKRRK